MGKFRQILTVICPRHAHIFVFLCKCQGILTELGTCINMKEILLGIANVQISSMFDRFFCPRYDNGGVL